MILVKLQSDNDDESGSKYLTEWAAIEIQGELESRHNTPLECQYVGDLFATIKDNVPILIIGHHILYGKMQTFPKPLAVMKKKEISDGINGRNEYIVEAVVTKKLLFKNRPKPIIANVNKS
ncbi:chromosome transmission fidelity protein 8 homolog [Daktulosphaira vitifoliae]|uniref:chromosome transmission fidelity protein 8 homolog n=1 Tax=Daktulosphaira vitifoliae TaxID=58002 RepID=UPI0021AA3919|nr:chromosome transmission fidelity protein 8 homolog [Daktulosphaira vitifoliae]XP_050524452.1 chromosome transmission fidelity protein 8 homolog [Daktulosphaira vitifoliae]XP_050524453.1 chromosome transmission fidelity protein 8 homolog [Daktulosphaira vitifoliae]XP_050524454.1 chromosome transmission fidelity protein 8 homolog [Daktulosphaira vitifoliae]XP_050524455.1 chromosome transmission fidelity protein 8 homolog [Daktulosphaira vitifoliae]